MYIITSRITMYKIVKFVREKEKEREGGERGRKIVKKSRGDRKKVVRETCHIF